MADRALENNPLALRNSYRRDLLREEMDSLKCSLEVRSVTHQNARIRKCQWGPYEYTLR